MKKIISMILICATFFMCVPTVMAKTGVADMITIKIVDKNNVGVSNAEVQTIIVDPYVASVNTKQTDRFGSVRLYNMTNGTQKVELTVNVTMRSLTDKTTTETVVSNIEEFKNGGVYTVKLKGVDNKKEIEKSKDRVDIYLENSKGKPVSNMKVSLGGSLHSIPLTSGSATNSVDGVSLVSTDKNDTTYDKSYFTSDGGYEGYTDKNGRLTFPNVAKDTYNVSFTWKGKNNRTEYGGYDIEDIKVTNKSGVKTFTLSFDESKLLK